MSKPFVGIDNGVTGSIGIIYSDGRSTFIETPVFKELSYTKEKQYIHRINTIDIANNFPKKAIVFLERPMVNPRAFTATQSALRALEAILIVLEGLGYKRDESYFYVDSKTWIVDMCGNYDIFGRVEDMDLVEYNDNIWFVESRGRRLTNVYLSEIMKD
jgi:hypothetical protein